MKPFYAQRQFIKHVLTDDDFIYLALGSVRSAKTAGASLSFIYRALHNKSGHDFLLSGRSTKTVEGNVIRPYLSPMCKERGIYYNFNRSDWTIQIDKTLIEVKGAINDKSQDLIQGRTYHTAMLDEIALIPQTFVDQTMARLSLDESKLIATMNPTGKMHWIKTEFIDVQQDMYQQMFHINDNPYLSDAVKERFNRSFSGATHQRMIDGVFADAGGLVYQRASIWEDELPPFDLIVCGVDDAISGTTAAVWLGRIEGTRKWIIFDEYYYLGKESPLSTQAHAKQIVNAHRDVVGSYIVDPAAPGMALAIRELTSTRVLPGYNKVVPGIQVVDLAFSSEQLYIYKDCINVQNERSSYIWDENAAKLGEDKPVKMFDHAMDATRYAAMGVMPDLVRNLGRSPRDGSLGRVA